MRSKPMLLVLTSLLFPLFSGSAAAQTSCKSLFVNPTAQEQLLQKMENLEVEIVAHVKSESNSEHQTIYDHALSELQNLITQTLESNRQSALISYKAELDEISETIAWLDGVKAEEAKRNEMGVIDDGTVKLQAQMTGQGRKDFVFLADYLKAKFNEFIKELERIESIRSLADNWGVERVNMREILDKPGYTVRLNHSYRVLFTVDQAQTITVHAISKTLKPDPP